MSAERRRASSGPNVPTRAPWFGDLPRLAVCAGRRAALETSGAARKAKGGVLSNAAFVVRGGTSGALDLANVGRLKPLRAPRHVELQGLTLGEGLEAIALNGRVMNEHVLAAFLRDEAEPLRLVEPLHSTTCHMQLLVSGSEDPSNATRTRGGCARST